MDRLHRIRLLMGDAAIEKLQKSTVMVVGCGAVGSFVIEALARSGIGNIIIVDFDKIVPTMLGSLSQFAWGDIVIAVVIVLVLALCMVFARRGLCQLL